MQRRIFLQGLMALAVAMLQAGLMKKPSAERAVLMACPPARAMERRGDA